MKYFFVCVFNLFFITGLYAQTTYAEMGAVGSFFKQYTLSNHAFGGQLTANYQFKNGMLTGIGVQALRFKDDHKGYYPLYARLGYAIPLSPAVITMHADGGYGIYKNHGIGLADGRTDIKGGLYFSPGIAVHGRQKFSPYIDVRYTRYQFKTTDYGIRKYTNNLNAFTASVGVCILNRKR